MRRGSSWVIAVAAVLAGWSGVSARATAGELSVTGDLAFVSQYVWRGIQFDDKASFQPTATVEYRPAPAWSLAVTGWWNVALDDHDSPTHKDTLFEQDFTFIASYEPEGAWSWNAGYTYYSNPHSDVEPGIESWQTDEVFAGCTWTTGAFSHTATLNVDIDKVRGEYLDLSSGPEISLSDGLTLTPKLHLGLASGMAPDSDQASWYTKNGLVDGNLSVALSWTLGEHFELGASLAESKRFDDYHEETGESDAYFIAGVLLRAKI
jgi:hypothetical protein